MIATRSGASTKINNPINRAPRQPVAQQAGIGIAALVRNLKQRFTQIAMGELFLPKRSGRIPGARSGDEHMRVGRLDGLIGGDRLILVQIRRAKHGQLQSGS